VSTTLYVSNLPVSATEEMLAGKFGKFGTVIAVRLNRDPATGTSQRTGFVEMTTAREAQVAIDSLNFSSVDGRLMSVYRATVPAPKLSS
jgi:RNA recognition motif-containing protein